LNSFSGCHRSKSLPEAIHHLVNSEFPQSAQPQSPTALLLAASQDRKKE
jgi:hypothetical protein